MKKTLLIITALMCMFSSNAQEVPSFDQMCKVPGVKDCAVVFEGTDSAFYYFNFTQQLGKKFGTQQSDTTSFTTRVLAIIKDVSQPTLFYLTGYDLSPNEENLVRRFNAYKMVCPDFFDNYPNANLIVMEHRFFGPIKKDTITGFLITTPGLSSYPSDFTNKLDYLTTENAAADFHNIISAFRKHILKGKTVMTGWSKGGMSTALQSYYYPEDLDVFIAYSSPFCNTTEDTRLFAWMNDSIQKGSSELRIKERQYLDYMMKKSSDNYVYNEYRRLKTQTYKNDKDYKNYTDSYIDTLVQVDFEDEVYHQLRWSLWAYKDRKTISRFIQTDSLKTSNNLSELLLYSLWTNSIQTEVPENWKDHVMRKPVELRTRKFKPITGRQWYELDTLNGYIAYNYQSYVELGNYKVTIKDDYPECMTAKYTPIPNWGDSIYTELKKEYTHSTYEKLFESVKNTNSKILFIYGGDDPWTGARIEDKYLGAANVKRYILPSQNHRVYIKNAPEELKNEILQNTLFAWLGNPATGIVTRDSRLMTHDSAIYDLAGRKLGNLESQGLSNLQKGIYIVNGKKYINK